eukprot:CAMPEP_0178382814 /NCGR_PEP_ID=MMETSP0689_2-20121128/6684_1 /TAXON_ID=160604 /ORGANISM="Amphidinium massartii, Strain CS-259" /LENGTH=428 /DNA_ID=CAMNT_0020003023 /DNA_START=65 /DNA_END=1349 /DNA_ORIENTATION=+
MHIACCHVQGSELVAVPNPEAGAFVILVGSIWILVVEMAKDYSVAAGLIHDGALIVDAEPDDLHHKVDSEAGLSHIGFAFASRKHEMLQAALCVALVSACRTSARPASLVLHVLGTSDDIMGLTQLKQQWQEGISGGSDGHDCQLVTHVLGGRSAGAWRGLFPKVKASEAILANFALHVHFPTILARSGVEVALFTVVDVLFEGVGRAEAIVGECTAIMHGDASAIGCAEGGQYSWDTDVWVINTSKWREHRLDQHLLKFASGLSRIGGPHAVVQGYFEMPSVRNRYTLMTQGLLENPPDLNPCDDRLIQFPQRKALGKPWQIQTNASWCSGVGDLTYAPTLHDRLSCERRAYCHWQDLYAEVHGWDLTARPVEIPWEFKEKLHHPRKKKFGGDFGFPTKAEASTSPMRATTTTSPASSGKRKSSPTT